MRALRIIATAAACLFVTLVIISTVARAVTSASSSGSHAHGAASTLLSPEAPRSWSAYRVEAVARRPVRSLRRRARASFAGLRRRLAGDAQISIAVEPLGTGSTAVLGSNPSVIGMSTTKILILAALLRDKGGFRHLSSTERAWAHAAITRSDNDAILALFQVLERDRGGLIGASAYATRLLRDAGDSVTTVTTAPPPAGYATTFGQTPWRPSNAVKFFRYLALGCLLRRADTAYILGLMRSIEPSESWGLGSAGYASVAFKGGWGPEPGNAYGVRQTGIVGRGGRAYVVALTADPAETFDVGTSVLTDMARWLRDQLFPASRPIPSCSRARDVADAA